MGLEEGMFMGDGKSVDSSDNLANVLKNLPQDRNNGLKTGGILVEKSSCCGVRVVQSEGPHDIGNGMYVGGVIVKYCPKCHKPYHKPVIGSVQ